MAVSTAGYRCAAGVCVIPLCIGSQAGPSGLGDRMRPRRMEAQSEPHGGGDVQYTVFDMATSCGGDDGLVFAKSLRAARLRARLSQAELAQRAGTSQAAVSDIERGRRRPTVERYDRLLRACGGQLAVMSGPPAFEVEPDHLMQLRDTAPLSPGERLSRLAPLFRLKGLAVRQERPPSAAAGDTIARVDLRVVQLAPEALLVSLARGGLDFIITGGVAAILRGDIVTTADLDVTVTATPENLRALAGVLQVVEARWLVEVNDLAVATIAGASCAEVFEKFRSAKWLTRHGILDVILAPLPKDGDDTHSQATTVTVSEGAAVRVATLDRLIAAKAEGSRPRDRYDHARLTALREILASLSTPESE